MRRIYGATFVILALLLLLTGYAPRVGAPSPPLQFLVNVTNRAVSVSINLNLVQNITSFESSFTLPQLRVSALGVNSTGLAETVQRALQLKNRNALVSNLNLQFGSSAWSNATSRQWLNMSLSFEVSGVTLPQGAVAQVDLSWKSFAVSSGYSLGGVEVNRIGEAYLVGVAADLAAMRSTSQFIQTSYQVNGRTYDPTQFPDAVRNIFVLNFSSFATPISQWQQQPYVALGGSQGWSFTGARGLGMIFIQQIQEPGSSSRAVYGLSYDLVGKITATGSARADGDTVFLVVSNLPEMIMAATIVSVTLLGTATYVWERRVLNTGRRKRPKR